MPNQPPIPAATLIVVRDREGEDPELLFVERSAAMRFAGGAIVFPGGRVDEADHALARLSVLEGDQAEDLAARVAAIRETIEEAGVVLGVAGKGNPAQLQAALHSDHPLGEALASAGYRLALEQLEPFARWCPDFPHARVFDTRFYLARMAEGLPEPKVDGTENVRVFWSTAADVLAAADRGEVRLIFPTRRTLERLARYRSYEEAVEDARAWPIRKIIPWIEQVDEVEMLCIPDDLGFPITRAPLQGAFRG